MVVVGTSGTGWTCVETSIQRRSGEHTRAVPFQAALNGRTSVSRLVDSVGPCQMHGKARTFSGCRSRISPSPPQICSRGPRPLPCRAVGMHSPEAATAVSGTCRARGAISNRPFGSACRRVISSPPRAGRTVMIAPGSGRVFGTPGRSTGDTGPARAMPRMPDALALAPPRTMLQADLRPADRRGW